MDRSCYIIEAENGVGLYLSKCLMEKSFKYLSKNDSRYMKYDTYEEAKSYIFDKYRYDSEIHLEKFQINRTLFRDKSQRRYFYIQSRNVIGYGIDAGIIIAFKGIFGISEYDAVEVASEYEAEACARRGFVEEYGEPTYFYSGELCPGESIAFTEMLWTNGFCKSKPTFQKIYGARR